ncbi:putative RING-H2 finger protein ATL37 [Rhagoletis pomonella]|uniref:putative RING-H2 finger protein ATL37 n=1 Tax=Rhagoletis pomonella TaxID=28610 RepID=UPI001780AEAB|nr:putative RING-H2 finger protein ATL37 [Rhagoletis pomonella]XP_036346824.1 putative RING-H2 finger protein ATL37 [Rhagoletis pomonella]
MAVMIRSTENLANLTAEASACSCAICLQDMPSGNDCWITFCNHVFHKNCIEQRLTTSHDCPVCRKRVNKRDLQPINTDHKPKKKNEGTIVTGNTGVFNSTLPDADQTARFTGNRARNNSNYRQTQPLVNYDRIGEMINETVNRMFANLNLNVAQTVAQTYAHSNNSSVEGNETDLSEISVP